ncbi:MAG TPA: glycosyltransferase family 2 protein [Caulobacteraceae bacterium]
MAEMAPEMIRESCDFLVVIPTCARPLLLAEAIESALGQTGATKKVMVVDDCPDGSAQAVAKRFASAGVAYLRHPRPTGGWPGRVRNFGFAAARATGIEADFIHFLDDDDVAAEGFYAAAKRAFAAHPRLAVVFGVLEPFCDPSPDADVRRLQQIQLSQARRWRTNAARVARLYQRVGGALGQSWVTQGLFALQSMFGPELFLCSGGVIRQRSLTGLGGFDPRYRLMEDHEFYTRAIRSGGVHFLDQVCAFYRLGRADSLWGPIGIDDQSRIEREAEIARTLRARQRDIRRETDNRFIHLALKLAWRGAVQVAAYGALAKAGLAGAERPAGAAPDGSAGAAAPSK